MKKQLRKLVNKLRRGKKVAPSVKRRDNRSARKERISADHASGILASNSLWPQLVARDVKDTCLENFLQATNSASLRTKVCAVCGEEKISSELHSSLMELTPEDVALLTRDLSSPISDPLLLDPTYSGLYLDHNGIVKQDKGKSLLRMCRICLRRLDNGSLPPNSIANGLELGDVPECLKNLSVVEESMIARRRARCCVIHLKDDKARDKDDESAGAAAARSPTDQRGFVVI